MDGIQLISRLNARTLAAGFGLEPGTGAVNQSHMSGVGIVQHGWSSMVVVLGSAS